MPTNIHFFNTDGYLTVISYNVQRWFFLLDMKILALKKIRKEKKFFFLKESGKNTNNLV